MKDNIIKKYLSVDLTFLFQIFKSIFLVTLLVYTNDSLAIKKLQFGEDSQIQILSDKAYRNSSDNSYEAQGNVIIKLKNDAIYGEKATFSFKTGVGKIWGNVRYVGAEFTLYGTQVEYDLKDKTLRIINAKFVDQSFTIIGSEIIRNTKGEFEVTDAEYTTCRDCPESWSIEGAKVKVIPKQYIYITHAFIKLKGVTITYIPYIVLPIKDGRESGVLFPRLGFGIERGFYFQLPFYLVTGESSDITFSPTSYGQRAKGIEAQYRYAINSDSVFNLKTLQTFDQIWTLGKTNDDKLADKEHRQLYEADLFYTPNDNFSIFFNSKYLSDLDIQSDYEVYLGESLVQNNIGYEFGLRLNSSLTSFTLDGSFKNNSFFENAKGFDHSYVQILPSASLSHNPLNLFNNFGPFSKISLQQGINVDSYRQNHRSESSLIRNANRYNYTGNLKFYFKPIYGLNLDTEYIFDYQHYELPLETSKKRADKYGKLIKTRAYLIFDKSFGNAYIKETKVKASKETVFDESLIKSVPVTEIGEEIRKEIISSYKHIFQTGINHYFYDEQKFKGSDKLYEQFIAPDSAGRFDQVDRIRGTETNVFDSATRTDLAEANTIELDIRNSLVKKTPVSNLNPYTNFKSSFQNFSFSKVGYFNISQGVLLEKNEKDVNFSDRLTRLKATTGLSLGDFNLSLTEYFFHQSGKHITDVNIRHKINRFEYKLTYAYDSFSIDRRYLETELKLKLNDLFTFETGHYYDFEKSRVYESFVKTLYSPINNCWKFDIEYREKDVIRDLNQVKDRVVGLNFYVNFNSKNFNSILGLQL